MSEVEDKSWNGLLAKLLDETEKFLVENNDNNSLIQNCLRGALINQLTPEREKILKQSLSNIESKRYMQVVKSKKLFNVVVALNPHSVNYLDEFYGELRTIIPKHLEGFVNEIKLCFNDPKYNDVWPISQLEKTDQGQILKFSRHGLYLLPKNRIFITEVIFTGKAKGKNDTDITFEFIIK